MKKGYLQSKEHRDWRQKIIDRDGSCVICGKTKSLNAHHLIPKEIEKFRTNIDNGIALCFKHHTRYGHGISPHSHGSALFFLWFMKYRPEQFEKVMKLWEEV